MIESFGPLQETKVISISLGKGVIGVGYAMADWFKTEASGLSCLIVDDLEVSFFFAGNTDSIGVGMPKYDTLNSVPTFKDVFSCPSRTYVKAGANTMHPEGTMISVPQSMSKMIKPVPQHTKPLAVYIAANCASEGSYITIKINYRSLGVRYTVVDVDLKVST